MLSKVGAEKTGKKIILRYSYQHFRVVNLPRQVNTPVLEELIAARHTAAVKLGFSCHAERMLASKMAGNLKTAKGFLD